MPKPVPLTYTDNSGVIKQVNDFDEILKDPDTPSIVEVTAPGVGNINFTKPIDTYFKFTREKQAALLKPFERIVFTLLAILQNNQNISDDTINQLFANFPTEVKKYFWQMLFCCSLDNETKKRLFTVLKPILQLDMHEALKLVMYNPQFLSIAFTMWGKDFGNQKVLNTPCICSFVNGLLTQDKLVSLDLFIKYGCNFNMQDPSCGTLLHSFLANELTPNALTLIDKLVQAKSIPTYNFAAIDSENKTPLLIAAKTRQFKAVVRLCSIYKEHQIDIGLDIPDEHGRTPIMLAAALGDLVSFKTLQQAGANLKLKDLHGNDLEFYLNASPELIQEILASIHIEAKRDYKAPHNWLYFNDQLYRPTTHENSPEKHKRVLISFAPENIDLLRATIMAAYHKDDNKSLYNFYLNQLAPIGTEVSTSKEKFEDYFRNKINFPQRKTFLDICLEGQSLVKQSYAVASLKPKLNPRQF